VARLVLVADDSPTIQKRALGILKGEGFDVETVSNGVAAIKRLGTLHPSVVLADVSMPGRDGYEVCEFVKRSEEFGRVPVLLVVSDMEPYDSARGAEVRADGIIRKPFEPHELISLVERCAENYEALKPMPEVPRLAVVPPTPEWVNPNEDIASEPPSEPPPSVSPAIPEGVAFTEAGWMSPSFAPAAGQEFPLTDPAFPPSGSAEVLTEPTERDLVTGHQFEPEVEFAAPQPEAETAVAPAPDVAVNPELEISAASEVASGPGEPALVHPALAEVSPDFELGVEPRIDAAAQETALVSAVPESRAVATPEAESQSMDAYPEVIAEPAPAASDSLPSDGATVFETSALLEDLEILPPLSPLAVTEAVPGEASGTSAVAAPEPAVETPITKSGPASPSPYTATPPEFDLSEFAAMAVLPVPESAEPPAAPEAPAEALAAAVPPSETPAAEEPTELKNADTTEFAPLEFNLSEFVSTVIPPISDFAELPAPPKAPIETPAAPELTSEVATAQESVDFKEEAVEPAAVPAEVSEIVPDASAEGKLPAEGLCEAPATRVEAPSETTSLETTPEESADSPSEAPAPEAAVESVPELTVAEEPAKLPVVSTDAALADPAGFAPAGAAADNVASAEAEPESAPASATVEALTPATPLAPSSAGPPAELSSAESVAEASVPQPASEPSSPPAPLPDWELIRSAVHRAVWRMSPPVLSSETVADVARQLADEILAEIAAEFASPKQ